MTRGIIFDMDGVIIDSEPINQRAVDIVLARYGKRLSDEQSQRLIGLADEPFFDEVIRLLGLKTTWHVLAASWQETVFRLMRDEGIEPIAGVRELVQTLHQDGYKLAVASSGEQRRIGFILNALGLQDYFSAVITADDVKKAKPDPEIYLTAINQLGLPSRACIAIEDSDRGVEAAKRAGLRVIGFRSPNSSGQRLEQADAVISSFAEWNAMLLQ